MIWTFHNPCQCAPRWASLLLQLPCSPNPTLKPTEALQKSQIGLIWFAMPHLTILENKIYLWSKSLSSLFQVSSQVRTWDCVGTRLELSSINLIYAHHVNSMFNSAKYHSFHPPKTDAPSNTIIITGDVNQISPPSLFAWDPTFSKVDIPLSRWAAPVQCTW